MKQDFNRPTNGAEPPYFLESLRIIEAAVDHDREKLTTYVSALVQKLTSDGYDTAARAIERSFNRSRERQLIPQSLLGRGDQIIRVPVDADSQIPLADLDYPIPEDTGYQLDVNVEPILERFVRFAEHRDKMLAAGISTPTNLLLYGPPGCGKTITARYLAARLRLPILTARADALISSYLGNTAKNIRSLFLAASSQNCVLFLDELDALGKARDDEHELGELKRVVIGLLQNLDSASNKIIVIAATNHEHLLDPAIWRRFPNRVHFGLPSTTFREDLFFQFIGDGTRGVSEALARLSAGLSAAEIREIVDHNRASAIIEGTSLNTSLIVADILSLRDPKNRYITDARLIVRKARALGPSYFTHQRLADLFQLSRAQVAAYLRG